MVQAIRFNSPSMTLEKQVALVNDLVKKEPDFTIRDYLELVAELDSIAAKADDPVSRKIDKDWKTDKIRARTHFSIW